VLGLLLLLVVIFLSLTGALWIGSVFLQSAFYSDVQAGMVWRAPAAALVLTLFLGVWMMLDYRAPGSFNTLLQFSATEDHQSDKIWSVKNGKEIPYTLRRNYQGRVEYRDEQGKLWNRSDADGLVEAIVIEDKDGSRKKFLPEMTADGKFAAKQGEPVIYHEEDGKRVMTDVYPGKLTTTRWGLLLGNLFMNFLHGVVWFLILWLILRFLWPHAFGLALALWLTLMFFLPALFSKVEDVARERAVTSSLTVLLINGSGLAEGRPVRCT
jgi:hypothetical protein